MSSKFKAGDRVRLTKEARDADHTRPSGDGVVARIDPSGLVRVRFWGVFALFAIEEDDLELWKGNDA